MERLFLLTPLREGRRLNREHEITQKGISTHAPAGGATATMQQKNMGTLYFYSRPCGRGDFQQ